MSKFALLVFVISVAARGETFSLQIASAVASQSFRLKSSAFVFRSVGCADPAKMDVVAKAEGRVNGQRRTVPLKTVNAQVPGVFGVYREWPSDGVWIVNLAAKCADASAGALVAVGEHGPNREASKFLPRVASEAEIDAALRELGAK
ncbi:MAG: hypothetical protein HYX27_08635 [Acidobacteria bacterium]|nr:hypothetical protein [Acidobacteriota bacterium]